jgi:hypothetical protein
MHIGRREGDRWGNCHLDSLNIYMTGREKTVSFHYPYKLFRQFLSESVLMTVVYDSGDFARLFIVVCLLGILLSFVAVFLELLGPYLYDRSLGLPLIWFWQATPSDPRHPLLWRHGKY